MRAFREWSVRLWQTVRPRRDDADLERELRAHLELEADAHGRSARYSGIVQATEAMRDQRGLRWLEDLARDIRYGIRTLAVTPAFTLIAVASLAIGNIVAIAQTNLKRMLAYSTISHMGFLLMGLLNGTPSGYAAAMFYAIAYAITASVAFGGILLLARSGFEAEEIDDFKGLNQRNPWYALVMLLAMASLAGVPPLFGFFAKLLVLKAALDAGMLWVVIVAIVMAIVGAYYYLRVIKVMYFDVADDKSALALPGDLPFRWLLSLNGAALLVLGLFWGPLIAWCYRAFGIS